MNLADMRSNVLADLDDAGGDVWSNSEIDRAIRRALRDYSAVCPHRAEASVELDEDGREVDLCVLLTFFGEVWQATLDRLNHRVDGHLLTIRHQGNILRIYRRSQNNGNPTFSSL